MAAMTRAGTENTPAWKTSVHASTTMPDGTRVTRAPPTLASCADKQGGHCLAVAPRRLYLGLLRATSGDESGPASPESSQFLQATVSASSDLSAPVIVRTGMGARASAGPGTRVGLDSA